MDLLKVGNGVCQGDRPTLDYVVLVYDVVAVFAIHSVHPNAFGDIRVGNIRVWCVDALASICIVEKKNEVSAPAN